MRKFSFLDMYSNIIERNPANSVDKRTLCKIQIKLRVELVKKHPRIAAGMFSISRLSKRVFSTLFSHENSIYCRNVFDDQ